MAPHEDPTFARARRRVAVCESLIANRRALIERLRAEGRSTERAEEALAMLEQTLKVLRDAVASFQ